MSDHVLMIHAICQTLSKKKAPFIHTGQTSNTGNGLFGDTKVIFAKMPYLVVALISKCCSMVPLILLILQFNNTNNTFNCPYLLRLSLVKTKITTDTFTSGAGNTYSKLSRPQPQL